MVIDRKRFAFERAIVLLRVRATRGALRSGRARGAAPSLCCASGAMPATQRRARLVALDGEPSPAERSQPRRPRQEARRPAQAFGRWAFRGSSMPRPALPTGCRRPRHARAALIAARTDRAARTQGPIARHERKEAPQRFDLRDVRFYRFRSCKHALISFASALSSSAS